MGRKETMLECIDFIHRQDCNAMERPRHVFEVLNASDQHKLTPCIGPLEVPFDWSALPINFLIVPEQQPRHSVPTAIGRGPVIECVR